jgi:hypothetical protein
MLAGVQRAVARAAGDAEAVAAIDAVGQRGGNCCSLSKERGGKLRWWLIFDTVIFLLAGKSCMVFCNTWHTQTVLLVITSLNSINLHEYALPAVVACWVLQLGASASLSLQKERLCLNTTGSSGSVYIGPKFCTGC